MLVVGRGPDATLTAGSQPTPDTPYYYRAVYNELASGGNISKRVYGCRRTSNAATVEGLLARLALGIEVEEQIRDHFGIGVCGSEQTGSQPTGSQPTGSQPTEAARNTCHVFLKGNKSEAWITEVCGRSGRQVGKHRYTMTFRQHADDTNLSRMWGNWGDTKSSAFDNLAGLIAHMTHIGEIECTRFTVCSVTASRCPTISRCRFGHGEIGQARTVRYTSSGMRTCVMPSCRRLAANR